MAEQNKPTRKDKAQRNVDDVVAMLGSVRGWWLLGALIAVAIVAGVFTVMDGFA